MDEEHREDPRFLHTLAELWHQTDEVPLTDQTRGQRKAIKERRKAREKAQKHQNRKSDAVAVEAHSQYAPLSNFLHTEPVAEKLCHLGHVGAPSAGIGRRSNYLSGPVSTLDAGRVR